jgi:lipopolysaccharide biosynthesis glycosyltransferase
MRHLKIPVLFCTDAIYFQHMGAAIASLLNSNSLHNFEIFVCSEQRDQAAEEKLLATVSRFGNATLTFIQFSLGRCREYLCLSQYFTAAAYIRLFLTEFLDPSIRRILYLDGDLIVRKDIQELWETDLKGAFVGVVPEPRSIPEGSEPSVYPYFNSGVMVVDVDRWRKENVLPPFLEHVKNNPGRLPHHDQDVLNHVFAGKVRLMDYRWNFQSRWASMEPESFAMNSETFRRVRRSPYIVHFATKYKPWIYEYEPHYKKLYYQALALTPWRGWTPPDRTPRSIILKFLKLKRLKELITWHVPGLNRYLRRLLGAKNQSQAVS